LLRKMHRLRGEVNQIRERIMTTKPTKRAKGKSSARTDTKTAAGEPPEIERIKEVVTQAVTGAVVAAITPAINTAFDAMAPLINAALGTIAPTKGPAAKHESDDAGRNR
jgi:hypothetical protein